MPCLPASRTYWGRFKVQHLQKACADREMQATGDKVQLMWRLICYTFEPAILGPEEWAWHDRES
eukprot:SAG22_NODE_2784_length_2212_cov_2.925225_6_plen_64_part_00